MNLRRSGSVAPAFVLALALAFAADAAQAAPRHVYLTWRSPDTATTIVVNYQTMADAPVSQVFYDTVSRKGGKPSDYAHRAEGAAHKIPGLEDGRSVHWVELTGLEPGRPYYFVAGDDANGFSEERKFRTIPVDATDLTFVTGGDNGVGPSAERLFAHAGTHDPAFCLMGGDLAYANGRVASFGNWDRWLDYWDAGLKTTDGFAIPMVLGIGNHETLSGFGANQPERAPFWFGYFAQTSNKESYFARRFGRDILLLVLDTSHITPHAMQVDWMRERLTEAAGLPATFACYHIPMYPSHRSYDGFHSALGRKVWQPVFDEFGLTAAFENHDHTYKRTPRIKANRIDPEGTLYIGDGAFGQGPRTVPAEHPWYLERYGALTHFWVVRVKDGKAEYRAYDAENRCFDVYPPEAEGAAAASLNYLMYKRRYLDSGQKHEE